MCHGATTGLHALSKARQQGAKFCLALLCQRRGDLLLQLRIGSAHLLEQRGLALRRCRRRRLCGLQRPEGLSVGGDLATDATLVRGQRDWRCAKLGQLALPGAQLRGETAQLHNLQASVGAQAQPNHRRQLEFAQWKAAGRASDDVFGLCRCGSRRRRGRSAGSAGGFSLALELGLLLGLALGLFFLLVLLEEVLVQVGSVVEADPVGGCRKHRQRPAQQPGTCHTDLVDDGVPRFVTRATAAPSRTAWPTRRRCCLSRSLARTRTI